MTDAQKIALYSADVIALAKSQGEDLETSDKWVHMIQEPKYEGPFPLLFQPDANAYTDYMKCFEKVLKPKFNEAGASEEQKEFLEKGLPFFSELEDGLDCSGFCYKPLFGIARPVKSGPVQTECAQAMVDTLDDLVAPGAICVLTGVILCCAFCGSVPLCFGLDKEDELDKP